MKNSLEQEKWSKFLKRVRLFKFVPFTEFVMASGSLVTGTLRESSDFDVLIGVKEGRIFTNRLFAVLIFGLAGYFKHHMHQRGLARDMICLNHFVTPGAYRLSPPHTDYDQEIYKNLTPIMGKEKQIKKFFYANDWVSPNREYERDKRYIGGGSSAVKKFAEFLLKNRLGNLVEKLSLFQARIIYRGLPKDIPEGARFICSSKELELHIGSPHIISKWRERREKS